MLTALLYLLLAVSDSAYRRIPTILIDMGELADPMDGNFLINNKEQK